MRAKTMNVRGKQAGFSISELLVVLAIIGLGVAIAVPITQQQVRAAKIRTAAEQFAGDMRAVRMIAVSKRTATDITVAAAPDNYYEYTDADGRLRRIEMPAGVTITSSTTPLTYQLNGSMTAASTSVFECQVGKSVTEQWTVTSSILGIPSVTHQRF